MGASAAELEAIDRWWRAANFLSAAQIYLRGDPLAGELASSSIKPRLLGHWGTCPGLNLVYAHLNRAIRHRQLEAIFLAGPGHGGPAMTANTWLEGSFSEAYPDVPRDREGMAELVRRFSAPYGMPSHAGAEVPGSMHEGGELGYVLAHAYGAVLDDPELVAVAVVGDGEAETGPLAASWHSHRFLAPDRDGAVLPVLHLNGYKIANPTILARMPAEQLDAMLRGFGHDPLVVEGDDPAAVHRRLADVLDLALDRIAEIQAAARDGAPTPGPWPMIVLRTPKGWTGPRLVDGEAVEGHFRSHQVPLEDVREDPEHLALLQEWLASYRPDELFDERGRPADDLRALAPVGERRMGANPRTNGGLRRRDLVLPPLEGHAVEVGDRGVTTAKATEVLGGWLADVVRADAATDQFRLFGPDEVASNRLSAVFDVTDRVWGEALRPDDVHLGRHGRVMEVLSEHLCQGWLEGYLLTGRHGLYTSYEAFIHIVDSMLNQHAKWLKVIDEVEWRRPLSSLNYLLTSHVWRQDHNGFSHQDPGFLDHVANKKADVVRIYLPPDANSLLAVMDRCLASQGRINVVVAGKQPSLQYLPLADARAHCAMGAGIWAWASTDAEAEPDAVLACAGDVPTMEALAAADLLRRHLPELRVRFVNVVDLMALESPERHPHGLSDRTFDSMFTRDRPVIFAHHGYPSLVHQLTYKRANHDGLHVHGYSEEGSTTTPFDMTVRNRIDRFHLALDVLDRVPGLGSRAARLRQHLERRLLEHHDHVRRHGEDLPEVRDWAWGRPT